MTPPRERATQPGPVCECATCLAWTPRPVVVRGNTQGFCESYAVHVGADFGCDDHPDLPKEKADA